MARQSGQAKPISLFYSYSHEDEKPRLRLELYLGLLQRSGVIAEWHCRKIEADHTWKDQIDPNLTLADIILLLVSPYFIASDYCYGTEVIRALERHDRGEAQVIPVILRECVLEGTPFSRLQALPGKTKSIMSGSVWKRDRDRAFDDVMSGIRRAVRATA